MVTANAATLCIAFLSDIKVPAWDMAVEAGVIERLIALLALSKDSAVRRNCAMAIARLVRAGGKYETRVRELRGMEMITAMSKTGIFG